MEGTRHPGVGTGMFREAAAKSIVGEKETTHQWSVGLTRKCLGPGPVQGLEGVKLDRCFESRLGRTIGATLTGFNLEGEKPRMALKQQNDSVVLVAPPTPRLAVDHSRVCSQPGWGALLRTVRA